MAHGVPILTHDVGAVTETLPAGAVIIGRYDADAAVRALEELVMDDASRHALGRAARTLVENVYDWDVVATRYEKIYEEAIDERRRTTNTLA